MDFKVLSFEGGIDIFFDVKKLIESVNVVSELSNLGHRNYST